MGFDKQIHYLKLYLGVWMAVVMFLAVGLILAGKKFNQGGLESMLATKARWSDETEDFCKYQMYGDPADAETNWAKLNFRCKDGRVSLNTLDVDAIKGWTVKDLVDEYQRINNIKSDGIFNLEKWVCFIDTKEVTNWELDIRTPLVIDCKEK